MNILDNALRYALGPDVGALLADPATTDIMLNADGKIWLDGAATGRVDTGIVMEQEKAMTALRLIAHHCGEPITRDQPLLSAEIPITGERIAATIPPVTSAPTFAIRKPPGVIFQLHQFEPSAGDASGKATARAYSFTNNMEKLLSAVEERRNILIAGATGSGKTSLMSSLMQLPSFTEDRTGVIEDVRELAISSPDHVRMISSRIVPPNALVQHMLRYRDDRLIIGEVRSGETTIEMIQAMNTGHDGSLASIHANSAMDALGRIEDLMSVRFVAPPKRAIATAIGCIVFVARPETGRRTIQDVIYINGVTKDGDYICL